MKTPAKAHIAAAAFAITTLLAACANLAPRGFRIQVSPNSESTTCTATRPPRLPPEARAVASPETK